MKRPADVTLGIDLANRTGICEIKWGSTSATITRLKVVPDITTKTGWGVVQYAVVKAHEKGWWVGIDAPFGFPEAFGQSVEALRDPTGKTSGSPHAFSQAPFSDARVWRATEKIINGTSGKSPRSVVTDYITGHVINCDDLRCEAIGRARNWADGRLGCTTGIVEVYPAAALEIWKAPVRKYKTNKNDLKELVEWLTKNATTKSATWLGGLTKGKPPHLTTLASDDDAFDALICALMARLASLPGGPTCPYHHTFTPAQMDLFRSEGWIHIPPSGSTLRYLDPANIPNIGQCPQCGG